MARQGYDLSLVRFDAQAWQAVFYVTGIAHSLTSDVGQGWQKVPWGAVQQAAWAALSKAGYGRQAYDTAAA